MNPQRFESTLTKSGSRAVIRIPFDPDQTWGAKERHYIRGTVNGCTVRGRLEREGEGIVLAVGPAWRRDNGIKIGQHVEVELLPEGPLGERLAPDIAAALESDSAARAFFESLATFYRKNYVRWIESAKRPETRANRIAEMMHLLKAGKRER